MLMLVRPVQPPNAKPPMLVTDEGMVMLVRLVQPENTPSPILVTDAGMSMLVRPVQPRNALSPMAVTELGTVVFMQPATSVLLAVSMMALQLSRESYAVLPALTFMLARPVQ